MAAGEQKCAGFPSAVVYESPGEGKTNKSKPVQQLLWGDWLMLKEGEQGDWQEVDPRGPGGWMLKDAIQDNKLLEMTFVDVGQGDGCLIITPKDKQIIVDAGQEDNMFRFLNWKFGKFSKEFVFQAAIISHPDADHYYGFTPFFENANVKFETIYHNGIFEREAVSISKSLGQVEGKGEDKFLLDIVKDKDALSALSGKKQYYQMIKKALDSGRVGDIRWLSANDGYLPGYEANNSLSIQVLGPVSEPDAQNHPRLRWYGDIGKTKNGNSIVLKIKYNNVRIIVGGDLNSESETFLLGHYTGMSSPPKAGEKEQFIESARRVFESDIYKSCHHGSSDFSSSILEAINPVATVISSGDNEPYSHPRADALGTLGKFSRGNHPLIFSTELARSAKETLKSRDDLKNEMEKCVETEGMTPEQIDKARVAREEIYKKVGRSIAVYGAINLRTDGNNVVVAQRIEEPRGNDKEWDIYTLKRQPDGGLQYESKYIDV
jgi:beta-lactamase superfamily II metal-dependent hydrolase